MPIRIGQKCAPFCRRFGCFFPLLKTDWKVEIYPTAIFLRNGKKESVISFSLRGPFTKFLALLNAEKGYLEISGMASEGFFRFQIMVDREVTFVVKKRPRSCLVEFSGFPLEKIPIHSLPLSKERLSLGVRKKQDIDGINTRSNLAEILPIWHKIAGFYPEEKTKKPDVDLLYRTFWGEFRDVFCPAKDPYLLRIADTLSNPFSYGQSLIRSLFFVEEKGHLSFFLPPCFPFGKMTNSTFLENGLLDFVWSKKKMRKIYLRLQNDAFLSFSVKGSKTCRITTGKAVIKKKAYVKDPILFEKNKTYCLDRWER